MSTGTANTHDLYDFMRQITEEMASEYDRIQKRASEDPGTAGDEGEENWAELLREWLPSHYHVVTKGRLINESGETSPQVDVLVLKPSYPSKLRGKKLYLAAGVAAAFECKTTLKATHIREAVETCVKIKSLFRPRLGTPYEELHAPIIYGLLAHSHSWKGKSSTPRGNIQDSLFEASKKFVDHPRLELDILCVSDLDTWNRFIFAKTGVFSAQVQFEAKEAQSFQSSENVNEKEAFSTYYSLGQDAGGYMMPSTPIGAFLAHTYRKMAWTEKSVRDVALYFSETLHLGGVAFRERAWTHDIFSENTKLKLASPECCESGRWNEWVPLFL